MAHLHEAALRGDLAAISSHLSAGAAVNEAGESATTNACSTALHIAAENGSTACVLHLLAHGAQAELKDLWGHTAAHLAAQEGHVAVVEVRTSSAWPCARHSDAPCSRLLLV